MRPRDDPANAVPRAVAAALAMHAPRGAHIVVALSGGRDSSVLLDALCRAGPAGGHAVSAAHVHHGLSPNADAWQRFCVELCAERGVPLASRAVTVPRTPRSSLEAEARRVRYTALADAAAALHGAVVALAHHRDDQAETLLLQLLRGAGPRGLAAMPALRRDQRGLAWFRPLLDVPRSAIDAYAAARGLRWIDDESNVRPQHRRNAVRRTVMPALAALGGNVSATLARAAIHQAEAAQLADDLAAHDAPLADGGAALDRTGLAALPRHRARNVLRWFLRTRGLPPPSTAALAQMIAQLCGARDEARVRLAHAGAQIGVHQGRIRIHGPPAREFAVPWAGEAELELPHGVLAFASTPGAGLDARRLAQDPVQVRGRRGGERFQLAANRPRRALSEILRAHGIPEWERDALPLVFCGMALAAVAGVGIDPAFRATPGTPGVSVDWRPHRTAGAVDSRCAAIDNDGPPQAK